MPAQANLPSSVKAEPPRCLALTARIGTCWFKSSCLPWELSLPTEVAHGQLVLKVFFKHDRFLAGVKSCTQLWASNSVTTELDICTVTVHRWLIKAQKCKTLGAEVTHAYNIICAFYSDDHLPTYISLLTHVGNGRQSYMWQLQ